MKLASALLIYMNNVGLQNIVLTVNHGQECKRNNQNVFTKNAKSVRGALFHELSCVCMWRSLVKFSLGR